MLERPLVKLTDVISVGFETNNKGCIGFTVEFLGAFIQGRTEEEAIAKVNREVNLCLKWLGIEQKYDYRIQIIQRHQSSLSVEDADNEILLEADRGIMREEKFSLNYSCHKGTKTQSVDRIWIKTKG